MPKNNVFHTDDISADLKRKVSRLKSSLWDLDNTLYRVDHNIYNAFDTAIATTALQKGVNLHLDDAIKMARKSFEEKGYSGHIFIDQYGLSHEELHHTAHDLIDETLIRYCAETTRLFSEINIDHALITHGSGNWARKVLNHLGLHDYFPQTRLLAFEDYNFERKSESRRAFEIALERTGRQAAETIFIEDTLENLRIPHEMGMGTILVHHGDIPRDKLPNFVDFACHDARNVLSLIKDHSG